MTTRLAISASRGDRQVPGFLGLLGALQLAIGQRSLGAVMLVLAAVAWRASRGWVEIGPSELTIRLWGRGTSHVPRLDVTDVRVGRDLDLAEDALVNLPADRRPVTLVLVFSRPVTFGRGPCARPTTALALRGIDPEEAATALGVAIDERPARPRPAPSRPGRIAWRRPFGPRGSVQERVVSVLVAGLLVAVGHAVLDSDDAASGQVFDPVPSVPGALAAYDGFSPDYAYVYAWRTAPRSLRVRVDILRSPCSGAAWANPEHTVDLRGLRIGADGAFHRRARTVWRSEDGIDVMTSDLRGVVHPDAVRATLVRTDDYRGAWQGICRRTIRFTARPR